MESNQTTKVQFRKDFQSGELYHEWQDIYKRNGYWSQWARHRMKVALQSIDHYVCGQKDLAMDMGIGSGILLSELARRGYKAFGADFSMNMIRNSRARLIGSNNGLENRFMIADVESLPAKDDTFDLITCLGVLEYVSTDKLAMGEFYRVLRPGGYLVLAVASYHRIGGLFKLLRKKIMNQSIKKTVSSDGVISLKNQIRTIKPLDLRREATKTGFIVKKFMCFGGRLLGRYFPLRFYVPGLIYMGDHCLLVLKKP